MSDFKEPKKPSQNDGFVIYLTNGDAYHSSEVEELANFRNAIEDAWKKSPVGSLEDFELGSLLALIDNHKKQSE